MSNFLIAFLFSAGAGTWFYTKFAKRSGGGNLKPAIIGGVAIGVIIFIIAITLLSLIIKK